MVACRVTGEDDGSIESIEVVMAVGMDPAILKDATLSEIRDGFAVDLDPSVLRISSLPTVEDADPSAHAPSAQLPAPETSEKQPKAAAQAEAAELGDGRARIENVSLRSSQARAEAHVSLEYAGRTWSAVREGPNTSRRRYALIAEATLSGLEQILSDPGLFSVEDLQVVEAGDGPVVVVVLELTTRRAGQRLTGSCAAATAHGSVEEAVVRATLQAVNRLFTVFAENSQLPS